MTDEERIISDRLEVRNFKIQFIHLSNICFLFQHFAPNENEARKRFDRQDSKSSIERGSLNILSANFEVQLKY